MTDVLKLSFGVTKRAFTIGVVVATIAWSVAASLVIAPRAAHAAVASGDLVKGSLAAVYFIGSDGKRYVFTNDKAYKTWYADFSSVKTITDTELAAVQIGGNVTYKPGARMIKIQSDPKVYAIGHGGVLRWVATEAAAVALYGADWNKKIDDISDAFFVNYTVGSQINSASDFNVTNEQALSPSINADKGLAGGGAINVTLASDNSAGATVTRNAQGINLLKTTFSGTGTITGLTFKRSGAGIASDWANIYLYDGDTRLTNGRSVSSTTNEAAFSNLNIALSGSKSLTLVGDLVTTNAVVGNAHAFSLEAATAVISSTTVGGSFPVMGNTFTVSGSVGGSLTLAAASTPSNPKVGQQGVEVANFRMTAGANEDVSLRRLVMTNSGSAQFENLPNMKLMTGSTVVAQNPVISGNMATFVVAVPYTLPKGTNRVFSVTTDIGGANRPNTDTIRLYVDQTYDVFATGATYGVGVAITDNFASGNSTLLTIEGGQVTFAFNGPTTGDVAIGGNDIPVMKFSITAANHVEVRNLRLRLTCAVVADCIDAADTAVVNNQITDLKVKNADTGLVLAGPVDISSWTDAGADIQTRTYTDRFEVNAGQTLNLVFSLDILSANTTLATGTLTAQIDARILGDIRNLDSNTDIAVADIVPSTALAGNPQTVRSSALTIGLASSPTSATVTKGSTANALGINFTAGSSSDVKVTQIRLRAYTDTNADATYGNSSAVGGETQNVQDVVQSVSIWDGSTQVGITKSPDSSGDMNFTALAWTVPAGTTKTLTVKATLSNNVPFSGASDLFLIDLLGTGAANNQTNNVTAEDKDGNTVTATSAAWNDEGGGGVQDINLNDAVAGTENASTTTYTVAQGAGQVVVTGVGSGTIEVKLDGDTPVAGIVTANTNDNSLTRIKFTALNEDFLVTRLTVQNQNGASSRSVTSVRLYDKNGVLFCSGSLDTNNRLRCSNDAGLFTVSGDHVVSIKANIDQEGTGTTGANSGDQPRLAVYVAEAAGDSDDIKVVGVASGTALLDANVVDQGEAGFSTATFKYFDDASGTDEAIPTIQGNAFVIRKTQPTVATVASSTTLINGELSVYKFSVTAASNADVNLKQVNLVMSRSNVGIGGYRLLDNGADITDQVTILANITTGTTNPVNLETASALATGVTGGTVNIMFNTERTVSAGTTKTFEVRATVDSAAAGDSLSHFMPDDILFGNTNDSGVASHLGSSGITLGAGGVETLVIDADLNGALTAASETELAIATAWTGGNVTIANAGLVFSDPAAGTDNDAFVFVDTDRDGAYDVGTDAQLTTSADQVADMTAFNGVAEWPLIFSDPATGTDDDEVVYLDTNRNNAYNVGVDIRLATIAGNYGADLTTTEGLVLPVNGNLVWSDSSADGHSRATFDWTNGFNVNSLATSPQSLSL